MKEGEAPPLFLWQGLLASDVGNSKNYTSPPGSDTVLLRPKGIIIFIYLGLFNCGFKLKTKINWSYSL